MGLCDFQCSICSRGAASTTGLARGRSRDANLDAPAVGQPLRNSCSDPCGYRRYRNALDAVFSAERCRGQRTAAPRYQCWTAARTILGIACVHCLRDLSSSDSLATVPLFHHGINASDFQGAQFAEALEPWIGHLGASLFALGIFEAGIVAAIAISTSSAYAFGEVMHTGHSLNRPVRDAWPFYLTLIGSACAAAALVLIPNFPLEFVVLTVNRDRRAGDASGAGFSYASGE